MDSSLSIHSLEVTVEAVYETDSNTWMIQRPVPVDISALLWDHQPPLGSRTSFMSGNIKGLLIYVFMDLFKEPNLLSKKEKATYWLSKQEEKYSSDSSETVYECQPVSKKEVSPENYGCGIIACSR